MSSKLQITYRTCFKCEQKLPVSRYFKNGSYNNDICKACGFGNINEYRRSKFYKKLGLFNLIK